jgi:hypothetical protein
MATAHVIVAAAAIALFLKIEGHEGGFGESMVGSCGVRRNAGVVRSTDWLI